MKKSYKLADEIYEIENADFKQVKEWRQNGVVSWKLSDDVQLTHSADYMMWYLWKSYPDQARSFFKAVPSMHYDKERIRQMLDAQMWVCI